MRYLFVVCIFFLLTACQDVQPSTATVVQRDYLHTALQPTTSDQVKVINFWATWCAPCVEEMPAFEAVNKEQNVEVIFISLDDAAAVDTKVNPFLKANDITSTVVLLNDPYANEWVPLVDSHWDGAIPATIIIKGENKRFYNQSFTESELKEAIKTL